MSEREQTKSYDCMQQIIAVVTILNGGVGWPENV